MIPRRAGTGGDIDKVAEAAGHEGLALDEVVPMPANNFMLVWRKSSQALPGLRAPVDRPA